MAALVQVSACGGSASGDGAQSPQASAAPAPVGGAVPAPGPTAGPSPAPTPPAPSPLTPTSDPTLAPAPAATFADKPSAVEASRFLTQASFGPTLASIAELQTSGYTKWMSDQFAKPQTLYQPKIQQAEINWQVSNNTTTSASITGITDATGFSYLWWPHVATADDQLRQRIGFALSQLFVISFQDNSIKYYGIAVGNYYDTLARGAFGNFRQLLEDVTLHPLMGTYLSWRNNKKETYDGAGNVVRTPDENYAREVMQLFSIGLTQLNPDGSSKLDGAGQPIPTYTHDDIYGIAKVLTGWDKDPAAAAPPYATAGDLGVPMIPRYPSNHSITEKKFLGKTIAATSAATADTMRAELKVVLDTLFAHPNVGPFVGRQLIQRLVTSNPSPAYVRRVSTVFADNGSGVRGDMKAVVAAVLLDPEAHDRSKITDPQFGKLREPVVRMTNYLRAFNGRGNTANPSSMGIGVTGDPAVRLGQSPMNAPTVFNFFRPGYSPALGTLGDAGLLAPEMQITDEQSVVGYQNTLREAVQRNTTLMSSVTLDTSAELALVGDADVDALLDRLNLLLMQGQMPADVRSSVRSAVLSIPILNVAGTTKGDTERNRRLWTALYLLMASPEFIVQK